MEQLHNSLKSKRTSYRRLMRGLKVRREKFFNEFNAQHLEDGDRGPISFPLELPDELWGELKHLVPDIGHVRARRGRPAVSARIVTAAMLTMTYSQGTPNIYLGNKVISASTVRKYLKVWKRRRIFKRIKCVKLPPDLPLKPINWRWLKKIEYFTAL